MPLYDLKCEKCGHQEDHWVNRFEDLPKKCPACNSKRYKQVFHTPLVQAHYSPMHPRHKRGMEFHRNARKK